MNFRGTRPAHIHSKNGVSHHHACTVNLKACADGELKGQQEQAACADISVKSLHPLSCIFSLSFVLEDLNGNQERATFHYPSCHNLATTPVLLHGTQY